MAPKRKASEAVNAVDSTPVETTADMADRLRLKLLANKPNKPNKPNKRLKTRPTTTLDAMNSTPGALTFFDKLLREFRDKIYSYIRTDTPIIK